MELLGDRKRVEATLADHSAPSIPQQDRALFSLIDKANREAAKITQADMDTVKRAGWSDEAIYDALTVCALFRFFNTWTDSMGVRDMPPAAYARSGKRLAEQGYAAVDT